MISIYALYLELMSKGEVVRVVILSSSEDPPKLPTKRTFQFYHLRTHPNKQNSRGTGTGAGIQLSNLIVHLFIILGTQRLREYLIPSYKNSRWWKVVIWFSVDTGCYHYYYLRPPDKLWRLTLCLHRQYLSKLEIKIPSKQ